MFKFVLSAALALVSATAFAGVERPKPPLAVVMAEPFDKLCCYGNYKDADEAGQYSVAIGSASSYRVVPRDDGYFELWLYK